MSDLHIEPQSRRLAAQLARFDQRVQGALFECAAYHERIAQLAFSFPVLFYALATGLGPKNLRRNAVNLAVEGRPLPQVASRLWLPHCFRKLPPEACVGRLQWVLWLPEADRRLGAHVPDDPNAATAWFKCVSLAHLACDADFAFWIAKQDMFRGSMQAAEQATLTLGAFAWHSLYAQPKDSLRAHTPWTPDLTLRSAVLRLTTWLSEQVEVPHLSIEHAIRDWLPPPTFGRYQFVPLRTHGDLDAEALAMSNCVDTYSEDVMGHRRLLFSVRRAKERVATLEVRRDNATDRMNIADIKGPENQPCPPDVRQATVEWLRRLPLPLTCLCTRIRPLSPQASRNEIVEHGLEWSNLRPYREHAAQPSFWHMPDDQDNFASDLSFDTFRRGLYAAYRFSTLSSKDLGVTAIVNI